MEGGCTCGEVRYRLTERPLFVHCCHCRWCQRETGSAFALNALIETERVSLLRGAPEMGTLPSASGQGQEVARCPSCRTALWSHYGGTGRLMAFVRVGALDAPELCPPDIHIYTSTRLTWVVLDDRVPAMEGYYRRSAHWPAESLARFEAIKARLAASG
ncbi:GFA family protein [Cereibacter azotoformans]|nr:GFA family protein [Cereibacter azotoformans]ULB08999.1 GFA family protein [Cereibacter azotoformans]